VGHLVADASALVTLAAADALELLRLSPHGACTVPEVYQETVEAGVARGFPDAHAIARLFESRSLTTISPRRRVKVEGISLTDSLVLSLAEQLRADDLLVNDRKVLRKAEQRGLPARLTLEFVQDLYEQGKITRPNRDRLFQSFIDRNRYTEDFIRAFLLGE